MSGFLALLVWKGTHADYVPVRMSSSTEKFLYMPHTFMVADHKQSFRGDDNLSPEARAAMPVETLWLEEERRRAEARQQVFPDIPPYVYSSIVSASAHSHVQGCDHIRELQPGESLSSWIITNKRSQMNSAALQGKAHKMLIRIHLRLQSLTLFSSFAKLPRSIQ